MRAGRISVLTLVLAGGLRAGSLAAQERLAADELAAWREDLGVLATELPQRHRYAFADITAAQWDSAVAALHDRMPSLRRTQLLVELQRLVAFLGDAHTSITPVFDPALGVRYYPIEFYLFDEGLFVRAADPEYAAAVGGRVLGIGRVPAEAAVEAAGTLISADNEWWLRAWAPVMLGFPEMLDGLGLVDDMERLPLTVERDGERVTVEVRPAGPYEPRGHDPRGPIDRSDWTDMRGPGPPPLWLRNAGRPYWMEYIPEERLLYVAYRGVVSLPHDESNPAFWDRVFATADTVDIDRFVIDVRENVGGESFYNLRVVKGIVRRPDIDEDGKLFVVIGRRTFSAAMNLVTELERYTTAIFVGEPTGTSPHFFGDHRSLVLPNTGISVNISTQWWQTMDPRDDRRFVAPEVYAPLTADAYRRNVDPALEAIRAYSTGPPVADRMAEAISAGDTALAERVLAEARAEIANRYRYLESEVNALGYRFLRADSLEAAIAVFRINTRAYPHSANVYDSLGEAYETAGRREEAIAAYRRALRIDPDYPPSLAGLHRLRN